MSISGQVYFDVDNNGQLGVEELRIGGVTLTVSGTAVDGEPVQETQVTETDGSFAFQGLAEGTYTVVESHPILTLDGRELSSDPKVSIADDAFTVQLAAGDQVNDLLFGERGRIPQAITAADFLGSQHGDGVVVASDANSTRWYCLRGAWREFWHAELTVTTPMAQPATASLNATFRNTHGHRLEGSWPAGGRPLSPLGSLADRQLISATDPLTDITQAQRDAPTAEGEAVPPESSWTSAVDYLIGEEDADGVWFNRD